MLALPCCRAHGRAHSGRKDREKGAGHPPRRTTRRFLGVEGFAVQVTHCTNTTRKNPAPFVMKRNCEFVTSVGVNKPPGPFIHVPKISGMN